MPGKSNELHMKVLRHHSRYRLVDLGLHCGKWVSLVAGFGNGRKGVSLMYSSFESLFPSEYQRPPLKATIHIICQQS